MMIQKIYSFDEYEGFISELANHPLYSDPHFSYDKNNLYRSLKSKDRHAFVVLENGIVKGLFVFIILPDDRYVEMLIGFTKVEKVFTEMLEYMENNYCGYQMDFVFNPHNTAISRPLKSKGAIFEPEQMKMIQDGSVPNVSTNNIEQLSDKWMKQYCDLHSTDTSRLMYQRLLDDNKGNGYILTVDNKSHCIAYWDKARDSELAGKAELICIHSLPNNWHKGFGSKMMDMVLSDIKSSGYSEVVLWVFRDNLRARAFYEAKGFVLNDVTKVAFDTEEVFYSKFL